MAALMALPLIALALVALRGGSGPWLHLAASVLWPSVQETALLLAGLACVVTVTGTAMAWIVTAYDFPGRRFAEVALLLPLAFPVYVLAYAWIDLFHPLGPIQGAIRAVLGIARPADLRLPDLRSLPGAVLLFSLALYPYVYVAARAAFLTRMTALIEAGLTLGRSPLALFFKVSLPLAQGAIGMGLFLAMLEALNDVGAAEFLTLRTLTATVYDTWVNRSDLPGAAQIALVMLVLVVGLAAGVKRLQPEGRRIAGRRADHAFAGRRVSGLCGLGLLALALTPPLFGFALPFAHLVYHSQQRLRLNGVPPELLEAAGNTLLFAVLACLGVIGAALLASSAQRITGRRNPFREGLSRLGYAVPGTVLGVGLLMVLGAADDTIRAMAVALHLPPTGLILSASTFAVALACGLRFFRLAADRLDTGYAQIPRSCDDAARTLGRGPFVLFRRIHLPLLKPAVAAAGLLVLVDGLKELPATLLLRPLNVETLATLLYAEAARGTYENGAVAALLIVGAGLLPIVLLMGVGRRGSAPPPGEQA